MERQLEAYCAHLRNERQVSEHTLLAYRRDLAKVIDYCNSQGIAGWGALQIQQLRQLENDGIVKRLVYPEVPPRVEYSLTEWGQDLCPVLDALLNWSALREAQAAD